MEAVDFLLKPYEQGRVDIALERVRARIQSADPPARLSSDLIRKLDGRAQPTPRSASHYTTANTSCWRIRVRFLFRRGGRRCLRVDARPPVSVRRAQAKSRGEWNRSASFAPIYKRLPGRPPCVMIILAAAGRFVIRFSQLPFEREQIEVSRRRARLLGDMLN